MILPCSCSEIDDSSCLKVSLTEYMHDFHKYVTSSHTATANTLASSNIANRVQRIKLFVVTALITVLAINTNYTTGTQ